jgi:DNA-binding NarL/FixJ family response regulator
MATLRVLIADDHPVFRNGLRALLASTPQLAVVGEASTGAEAVARTAELQPDVVLMDLQMPGTGGIEATRRILEVNPRIRILVVTMYEDDDLVFAALRAGARGYVLKGASPPEVVRAVQAAGEGGAIFSPTIAQRLLQFFARPQPPTLAFPDLTEREREILSLMAQGRSNPEIAARLILSLKTVQNHVSNIFSKLQVADRAEAILLAREAGLGPPQR